MLGTDLLKVPVFWQSCRGTLPAAAFSRFQGKFCRQQNVTEGKLGLYKGSVEEIQYPSVILKLMSCYIAAIKAVFEHSRFLMQGCDYSSLFSLKAGELSFAVLSFFFSIINSLHFLRPYSLHDL